MLKQKINIHIEKLPLVGPSLMASSDEGLCYIGLGQTSTRHLEKLLSKANPDQKFQYKKMGGSFKAAIEQLIDYLGGRKRHFKIKLDMIGTSFQKLIWTSTLQIPYGTTMSYSQLAKRTRMPDAARAIGNALSRNPIPIIIPCHRIIRSDGKLGGFTALKGPKLKQQLLSLEGMSGKM